MIGLHIGSYYIINIILATLIICSIDSYDSFYLRLRKHHAKEQHWQDLHHILCNHWHTSHVHVLDEDGRSASGALHQLLLAPNSLFVAQVLQEQAENALLIDKIPRKQRRTGT
jgi:hypothetical protein